jgi:hypothetical protein
LVAVVAACFVFSPVLATLWRNFGLVRHAQSPEFRLSMPNLWTEIQQVKDAGLIQMMRMEDGKIIFLSIGLDTAKVFLAESLDSPSSFKELASFPLNAAAIRQNRRATGEAMLNQLRTAIGWPKSYSELKQSVERISAGSMDWRR